MSAFLRHPVQCGTTLCPQPVSPGSAALCHLCRTQAGVPCLGHVGRGQIRPPLPPLNLLPVTSRVALCLSPRHCEGT